MLPKFKFNIWVLLHEFTGLETVAFIGGLLLWNAGPQLYWKALSAVFWYVLTLLEHYKSAQTGVVAAKPENQA